LQLNNIVANRKVLVETRSLPLRERMEFTIPMPPPLNSLFANIPGKGRIKSARYRAWIKEAGWILTAGRHGRILGPVSIDIILQDGMRGDTDGRPKAILDLAVRHGLIEDDAGKFIRSLSITFGNVVGAKVIIQKVS